MDRSAQPGCRHVMPVLLPHCRYHLLRPEYIHQRIKELQRSYRLRIIMCHVDTDDAVEPLAQVVEGQGVQGTGGRGAG